MFKNLTISAKITTLVVLMVFISLATISYVSYYRANQGVLQKYYAILTSINNSRAEQISAEITKIQANIKRLQQTPSLTVGIIQKDTEVAFELPAPEPEYEDDSGTEDTEGLEGLEFELPAPPPQIVYDVQDFINQEKNALDVENIHITGQDGVVLFSTDPSYEAQSNFRDRKTLEMSKSDTYFSNIVQDSVTGNRISVGAPIKHEDGQKSVMILEVKMSRFTDIIQDSTGMGETGEMILAKLDTLTEKINFLNIPRNDNKKSIRPMKLADPNGKFIQSASKGESGSGGGDDYRNVPVIASWSYIPDVGWGFVTKIDEAEVYADSFGLLESFIVAGLVILVLTTLVSVVFSKYLSNPLKSLKTSLELVGNGILPEKVIQQSNDEIGAMAKSVNYLVQTLKKTAKFAQQIGEGNFDANFKPINSDDSLGVALVDMRDNLIEADKKDKQRNWIVTGVAEIGEILRAHDSLEILGDDVVQYIIGKIDAVQGAFYVLNDEDSDDHYLEMKSSFAYNRKKHLKVDFRFAEGLVGQAAAEKDTVLRTEIPEDYVSITSGILGDQRPSAILIVPLITEEKVYGVLEFAGFTKFDSGQVKFVEELSLILARTVFNIKINERTRKLLEESQALSAELTEKQEILRQNAEEMQATQEELQKSNSKLEEQIEEVNRTQKRMQLLLENASEVITIYEEDETIRYISPSVEPIMGYTQKEMIGSGDLDKVGEEHKEAFKDMFSKLLENPEEQITIQYEYQTKEGKFIWIESTGTNFMSNPAIHGIIVNSRDITERRNAEREQRMRSKMQALSENSPDLITRLENDAISYINPVIEEYTGNAPDQYLNHKMSETDLNATVLDKWLEIVEEVNNSNNKVATEMDFPSEMGDRVMQVNAIPEYDDNESLESVLVVSHDITERKVIELEIQNKNKKIADSINYAKRIQNAILPNNIVINNVLPDSFILYKPKDVVSGDFPWYVQMGDDIYMAAVDCTGHGVPGALLSLIGYFLLNDIVRSRKISDPGLILDQLDEGVTTTLRQDQDDSKTKDGMDIALCKLNMKTRKVEYSGAHRPLYVMKNGEMEEIKGNKFAIGGGIYKNQTNFTNFKLSLAKGDSIYFCSDGFPDQFGGPDNRKFGPKRTRELIVEIHEKSMKEAYQVFDERWEGWKANEKQTDDVLLIGIKF